MRRTSRSASACDRGEHQLLLLVVELVPAVEQGVGEALDAGQRRAQLVGDGRDQVGALRGRAGSAATAAEADRHPSTGRRRRAGRCTGRHEHLGAVGSSQDCSGTAGPDGDAG